MNELLYRMVIAALITSVKNPEKRAKLRPIQIEAVRGILLANADDPTFMQEVLEG